MGRSCTGKDTIHSRLLKSKELDLRAVVLHTTRPMREGEVDGVTYHFIDDKQWDEMEKLDMFIEAREYQTANGLWKYGTSVDELSKEGNLIAIGTLESYKTINKYNINKKIVPIYIRSNDEVIRSRAIKRSGKYMDEVERRLSADKIDFSIENVENAGIIEKDTFDNNGKINECLFDIINYIKKGERK